MNMNMNNILKTKLMVTLVIEKRRRKVKFENLPSNLLYILSCINHVYMYKPLMQFYSFS